MQHHPAPVSCLIIFSCLCLGVQVSRLPAHDGHRAVTYEVTEPLEEEFSGPQLHLTIADESGRPIAARFTITVDGEPHVPRRIGKEGLRFLSIHEGKRNRFVATYSRGRGPVVVPIPAGQRCEVTAARGFEFRTTTKSFDIAGGRADGEIRISRWIDLQAEHWTATDEHVHYDRGHQQHDEDWLTMLEADGLSSAHFLVLKGGNVPGVWAKQYAYGTAGEASAGDRFIRSGEEYRDRAQGHINLLGVTEVIEPISTGGIGGSEVFNYPPLLDVFRKAHQQGAIGGPAHGGALAKSSTALLDTVLGQVDFFEIANSHLYKTDVWYQLLNCGLIVPPVAGTDLPNFGYRDRWQPLFGEVRTYVQVREPGFRAWSEAVRSGKVFVTSGPLLRFTVDGVSAGGVIRLPNHGGEVEVDALLQSPRELESFELVRMGEPMLSDPERSVQDGITTLAIRRAVAIEESCWLAVRGVGGPKAAINAGLGIQQNEIAHSGIIQVLVGDQPIRSEADVTTVRDTLREQLKYYSEQARFASAQDRRRFIELFQQSIEQLE